MGFQLKCRRGEDQTLGSWAALRSDGHCLWRGQRRSDWEIKSSLARKAHRDSGHLQNFRDAIARCTRTEFDIWDHENSAEEEKIKLWALGQHFVAMAIVSGVASGARIGRLSRR